MGSDKIPACVVQLIAETIDPVSEPEALLPRHDNPGREWTLTEAGQRLPTIGLFVWRNVAALIALSATPNAGSAWLHGVRLISLALIPVAIIEKNFAGTPRWARTLRARGHHAK